MHIRTAAVAALAALMLTGCISVGATNEPEPSASTSAAAADKPASNPPARRTLTFGQASRWSDPNVAGTTTVLAYEQPLAQDAPRPESAGHMWAAAEIKVCNSARSTGSVGVSAAPWHLAYADGARVQPALANDPKFPQPAFPLEDAAVQPGDCLRGHVVFAVPGDARPERVVYEPRGIGVFEWAVE